MTEEVLDDIHAEAATEAEASEDLEYGRVGRPFGADVAIPVAAAVKLLLEGTAAPRLDRA